VRQAGVDWASLLIVFCVSWWLVFFMALPFGAQPPEHPEPGWTPSAPANPRLWTKAAITTLVAAAITGIFYWVAESGLVSLRGDPGF
jgi:predicted secreted protein